MKSKDFPLPHGFLCRKAPVHQLPFLQIHSVLRDQTWEVIKMAAVDVS